jgi:putative PIN family toxin of toxin-antitoxin system
MKIVLDTNVLVSGLLTPFGSSGKILSMICSGELLMCLDARIFSEYQEVLHRPKFAFDGENVAVLLGFFRQQGYFVSGLPLKHRLPDPTTNPFWK